MAGTAQKETEIFEDMPIRRAVLTLAVPTVVIQLIVMVYNLADTWVIGQTGDPYQVAAVTVAYPLFMLLSAFANLFGIGGSSLIALLLYWKESEVLIHENSSYHYAHIRDAAFPGRLRNTGRGAPVRGGADTGTDCLRVPCGGAGSNRGGNDRNDNREKSG